MQVYALFYDGGEWEDVQLYTELEGVLDYLRSIKTVKDNFHIETYKLGANSELVWDPYGTLRLPGLCLTKTS